MFVFWRIANCNLIIPYQLLIGSDVAFDDYVLNRESLKTGVTRHERGIMYAILECAVCVVLTFAISACLFGFWAAYILLHEALRRIGFLAKWILIASRPLTLELRPLPATSDAEWRPKTSRALPP